MSEQTPSEKNLVVQTASKPVKKSSLGSLKWLIAIAIIAASAWASFNVPAIPENLKSWLIPAGIVLALLVFLAGNVGRLLNYVSDSIKEVKKVVWPVRSYTLNMTGFVIVFVAIMAIFVYGVDTVISWLFFDLLLKRG